MIAATREKLHACAVYAMPDILWEQSRIANSRTVKDGNGNLKEVPGDVKAARFVAEIAKVVGMGGGGTQINNIIQPTVDMELTDEVLIRRIEDIARRRRVTPEEPDHG